MGNISSFVDEEFQKNKRNINIDTNLDEIDFDIATDLIFKQNGGKYLLTFCDALYGIRKITSSRFKKYWKDRKTPCENEGCDKKVSIHKNYCNRCYHTHYCSIDCQREHWGTHKHSCDNNGETRKDIEKGYKMAAFFELCLFSTHRPNMILNMMTEKKVWVVYNIDDKDLNMIYALSFTPRLENFKLIEEIFPRNIMTNFINNDNDMSMFRFFNTGSWVGENPFDAVNTIKRGFVCKYINETLNANRLLMNDRIFHMTCCFEDDKEDDKEDDIIGFSFQLTNISDKDISITDHGLYECILDQLSQAFKMSKNDLKNFTFKDKEDDKEDNDSNSESTEDEIQPQKKENKSKNNKKRKNNKKNKKK